MLGQKIKLNFYLQKNKIANTLKSLKIIKNIRHIQKGFK